MRDPAGGEADGRARVEPRRLAQAAVRRGQAPGADGAPEYSLLNVSEPIVSADLNFDGKVTLKEFLAAADRRFAQLDPDSLGYLTLDSLPRTPQQILVEGKKPRGK